jgi:hypothetical protein
MNEIGHVIRKTMARGSKSEHDAVVLVTDSGGEYVLQRQGGNPFRDPTLDELVGRSISCTGIVRGRTFIISECTPVDRNGRQGKR